MHQAGAHIKNMGGLYIREETDKKDNLRELYRVLQVTTDESKLQLRGQLR